MQQMVHSGTQGYASMLSLHFCIVFILFDNQKLALLPMFVSACLDRS
jgi:hypothetical protein